METQQLKELMKTGASIKVDAANYSVNDLMSLATYATEKEAKLTITSIHRLSADSCERIANRGGRHICFEF